MSSSSLSSVPFAETPPIKKKSPDQRSSLALLNISYLVFFVLANLVIGFCSITIPATIIPLQTVSLYGVSAQSTTWDAVIIGLGGLAGLFGMLFIGWLVDGTHLSRQLGFIGGVLCIFGGYALLGGVLGHPYIFMLCLGSLLSGFGGAAALVTLLVRLLEFQRTMGKVSALISMAPLAGNLVGQILTVGKTPASSAIVLGAISLIVFALYFCLDQLWTRIILAPDISAESHTDHTPLLRQFPLYLHSSAFICVWLSRFLMFLVLTTVSNYILFYLLIVLHDAAGQAPYFFGFTLALVVSAIVSGILSDRLQRRKIIAVCGGSITSVALLLLIINMLIKSIPLVLGGGVVFGVGLGMYLACDLVLATLVFPDRKKHGEGMGIMNTAIYLPVVLSPILAAVLITILPQFYLLLLYSVLCLFAVLATWILSRIQVR